MMLMFIHKEVWTVSWACLSPPPFIRLTLCVMLKLKVLTAREGPGWGWGRVWYGLRTPGEARAGDKEAASAS